MEAVVEYEYEAEGEDHLTLKVGDTISNVITAEGGWWEGELNGRKGMFPENFVKLVKRRDPAPSKKEGKREATQKKSVRELAKKFKDGLPKNKEKKQKCRVLFEYKREKEDELELAVGDVINCHKQVEEGWWEGTLNGKHGLFPSNFVEMIVVEETGSSGEAGVEEKEKDAVAPAAVSGAGEKEEFQAIKGKKVVGVGLGNIFGDGPIKLRSTEDKENNKEEPPKSNKPAESETAPEVAKREKQNREFDQIELTSQKLTHLTANRPKGPKKRPPSTSHHGETESPSSHREHSTGAPPGPPEPSSAPLHPSTPTSSAPSPQVTKLIEQLQNEVNELRANTVSKSAFDKLQAEHSRLKHFFFRSLFLFILILCFSSCVYFLQFFHFPFFFI